MPDASRAFTAYEVYIFDCDGVLLDTNDAKTRAFAETAEEAGYSAEVSSRFAAWQRINFGISRYRAFETLIDGRFGHPRRPGPPPTLAVLTEAFAARSRVIYETASETKGARELLETLIPKPVYVASGSDQAELREAFNRRDLRRYFVEVHGSPTSKREIVSRTLAEVRSRNPNANAVMIGDAEADADAAAAASIDFVFVRSYSTVGPAMMRRASAEGFAFVDTLEDLTTSFNVRTSSIGSTVNGTR